VLPPNLQVPVRSFACEVHAFTVQEKSFAVDLAKRFVVQHKDPLWVVSFDLLAELVLVKLRWLGSDLRLGLQLCQVNNELLRHT
jgi:hypothetical protein